MMERLILASGAATKTYEDGTVVSAKILEFRRPIPSSVAEHEAAHVVAAGEIVRATIIPSGDAQGTTQPVRMTAAAAAAAEAMGHSGTGWDMHLVKYYLETDPSAAKAAARAALSGKHEEMFEVATLLEERKTIGQSDVNEAFQNVSDKRQGTFDVEVEISVPGEKIITFPTKSFRGEVRIADLLPVSKAA
jgi:hypothetical protein